MNAPGSRFALFAYGFRPFFLGAALYAACGAVGWVVLWYGHIDFRPALPPSLWHGHEMLFGMLAAAIAGFLLTAVPNWTGCAAPRDAPLAALFGLWLAGRVAAWTCVDAPLAFALVDVWFLPALAAWTAVVIARQRLWRNMPIVGLLILFASLNLAVHLDALDIWAGAARPALYGAAGAIGVLVSIVGGRIIPAFTQNALRAAGMNVTLPPASALDAVAVTSVALGIVCDLGGIPGAITGTVFAVAAAANLARLLRWRGHQTIGMPIVWVLHLGYAWLVVGLAMRALAAGAGIGSDALGLHALSLGAFGTMVLGVMTRAALGHTGRVIRADGWIVAAYLCVSAGAAGRALFGPNLPGPMAEEVIGLSGALWAAGFLVYAIRFLPILALSRPDGRPG